MNALEDAIALENAKRRILRRERLSKVAAAVRNIDEDIYCLPSKYRAAFTSDDKYLLFKGGRGSGKTIAIVCHFIEESYKPEYKDSVFLFIREIAVSISDSVYSVVVDMIKQAGLAGEFKIMAQSITNLSTGVKFAFTGLRATAGKTAFSQINKIKGKHKITKIFGEEAQDLTEDSLNTLFPTVNRAGLVKLVNEWRTEEEQFTQSRFYFAMNPNLDKDPVVRKIEALTGCRIEHINIFDIEEEFRDAQLLQQAKDEEDEVYYDHVWKGAASWRIDGFPFAAMDVTVYAKVPEAHTCFFDPSFAGRDFSAITFVGVVEGQLCAWGYCFKKSWSLCIEEVKALVKKHKCKINFYEENAVGIVPANMFAEIGVKFTGFLTLGNKETKIYKVAAYTAHRTKLLKNWSNNEYVKNITEYNLDAEHDDAPDSFASAMIKAGIVSEKMRF